MPKIDVPQDLYDRLAKLVPTKTINQLAAVALNEWAAWFDGSFRPMSISELETERIYGIYNTVLPDDLPSVDNLGQRLGLPMGRARYIVQSLAYRRGKFLYDRQLRAIVRSLEEGQWSKDKTNCLVILDRSCQSIVDRVFSVLVADGQLPSSVKGTVVRDGVRYELGSGHHQALLKEFNALLMTLSADEKRRD